MKKSIESEIWCQLSGWPGVNCLISFWASVSSHLKWMRFFPPFFSFPVSSSLHPPPRVHTVFPFSCHSTCIFSHLFQVLFPPLSPFLIFLLSFSLISFLLSCFLFSLASHFPFHFSLLAACQYQFFLIWCQWSGTAVGHGGRGLSFYTFRPPQNHFFWKEEFVYMMYIELVHGRFMYSRLTLIPDKLGSKQCNIECKINFPVSDCGEICF